MLYVSAASVTLEPRNEIDVPLQSPVGVGTAAMPTNQHPQSGVFAATMSISCDFVVVRSTQCLKFVDLASESVIKKETAYTISIHPDFVAQSMDRQTIQ